MLDTRRPQVLLLGPPLLSWRTVQEDAGCAHVRLVGRPVIGVPPPFIGRALLLAPILSNCDASASNDCSHTLLARAPHPAMQHVHHPRIRGRGLQLQISFEGHFWARNGWLYDA